MSELRANTISDAAGTGPVALTSQWAAKSTSLYDQTVPTVNSSNNVSSITDRATGTQARNFTNNFNDAVYVPSGITSSLAPTSSNNTRQVTIDDRFGDLGALGLTTSAVYLKICSDSGSPGDLYYSSCASTGDLA